MDGGTIAYDPCESLGHRVSASKLDASNLRSLSLHDDWLDKVVPQTGIVGNDLMPHFLSEPFFSAKHFLLTIKLKGKHFYKHLAFCFWLQS